MKIFGIGLNKTGTRSVAAATRRLGFRTLHKGDDATSALVKRAIADGVPMLTYIGIHFDAYFDVAALVKGYQLLDAQYPGSRFIYTTRNIDDWIASRARHVLANQERLCRGEYAGTFVDLEPDAWRAEWHCHETSVMSYFDGRPDLLVLDVTSDDAWRKLASFLERPVPHGAFPHENRGGLGTYSGRTPKHLFRRALDRVRRIQRRCMSPFVASK